MTTQTGPTTGSAAVALAAALLYGTTHSVQRDLNGVIEALNAQAGQLLSPNHLLYRPLARGLQAAGELVGAGSDLLTVMQWLTVVFSAAGVGLFHRAATLLMPWYAALLGTALLATSWAHWVFSTDAYYITPAAALVAGAVAVVLSAGPGAVARLVLAGGLAGASVLIWQANVILCAVLPLGVLSERDTCGERVRRALVVAVAAGGVVAVAYYAAALLSGVTEPVAWVTSHGSDEQGRVPIWGVWSADRLPRAAVTALASIVPLWEGMGVRQLLKGQLIPAKIPSQAALVAVGWLVAQLAASLWRRGRRVDAADVWLLFGYASFWPFIVWWDPFEPKWFVVPNLFLAWLLAKHVATSKPRGFAVAAAAITFANLTATVWVRHTTKTPGELVAECYAARASSQDVAVLTDWEWFNYVRYDHGSGTGAIDMIGAAGVKGGAAAHLHREIATSMVAGRRVLLRDPLQADAGQWTVIHALTGLSAEDFAVLALEPAFSCGDVRFVRVVSAYPDVAR